MPNVIELLQLPVPVYLVLEFHGYTSKAIHTLYFASTTLTCCFSLFIWFFNSLYLPILLRIPYIVLIKGSQLKYRCSLQLTSMIPKVYPLPTACAWSRIFIWDPSILHIIIACILVSINGDLTLSIEDMQT